MFLHENIQDEIRKKQNTEMQSELVLTHPKQMKYLFPQATQVSLVLLMHFPPVSFLFTGKF